MAQFQRIIGKILLGVGTPNNGTAKLTCWYTASATTNGTYAAFATNTTVTLNTNNSEATLEVRADQLPSGTQFVQLNILVPVANAIIAAELWGSQSSYAPASQFNFTTNTSLLNQVVY
jgi:hypothetical protein